MATLESPAPTGGTVTPAANAATPAATPPKSPWDIYSKSLRMRMISDGFRQWQNQVGEFQSRIASARGLSTEAPDVCTDGHKALDALKAFTVDEAHPRWGQLILCNPDTLFDAARKLAELDIAVGGDEVGFGGIEFRRRDDQYHPYDAVPRPGVRSIERVLVKSGAVKKIDAFAVRQQDYYSYTQGGTADPEFRRNLNPDPEKPNAIYAAFCRIVLKDDTKHIVEVAIDPAVLEADRGRRTDTEAAADIARFAAMAEVIRMGYVERHAQGPTRLLKQVPELLALQERANAAVVAERGLPSLEQATPAPAVVAKPAQVAVEAKPAAVEAAPSVPMVPIVVGGEEWAQTPADRPSGIDPLQRSVTNAKAAMAEMTPPATTPATPAPAAAKAPAAAALPSPVTPKTGSGRRV